MEFLPCAERTSISGQTYIRKVVAYPSLMPHRIFDFDLVQFCAVFELYGDGISNGSFFWIMIFDTVAVLLYTSDFGPELVNARVGSGFIGAGVSGWL
jgi:hypothetical protein